MQPAAAQQQAPVEFFSMPRPDHQHIHSNDQNTAQNTGASAVPNPGGPADNGSTSSSAGTWAAHHQQGDPMVVYTADTTLSTEGADSTSTSDRQLRPPSLNNTVSNLTNLQRSYTQFDTSDSAEMSSPSGHTGQHVQESSKPAAQNLAYGLVLSRILDAKAPGSPGSRSITSGRSASKSPRPTEPPSNASPRTGASPSSGCATRHLQPWQIPDAVIGISPTSKRGQAFPQQQQQQREALALHTTPAGTQSGKVQKRSSSFSKPRATEALLAADSTAATPASEAFQSPGASHSANTSGEPLLFAAAPAASTAAVPKSLSAGAPAAFEPQTGMQADHLQQQLQWLQQQRQLLELSLSGKFPAVGGSASGAEAEGPGPVTDAAAAAAPLAADATAAARNPLQQQPASTTTQASEATVVPLSAADQIAPAAIPQESTTSTAAAPAKTAQHAAQHGKPAAARSSKASRRKGLFSCCFAGGGAVSDADTEKQQAGDGHSMQAADSVPAAQQQATGTAAGFNQALPQYAEHEQWRKTAVASAAAQGRKSEIWGVTHDYEPPKRVGGAPGQGSSGGQQPADFMIKAKYESSQDETAGLHQFNFAVKAAAAAAQSTTTTAAATAANPVYAAAGTLYLPPPLPQVMPQQLADSTGLQQPVPASVTGGLEHILLGGSSSSAGSVWRMSSSRKFSRQRSKQRSSAGNGDNSSNGSSRRGSSSSRGSSSAGESNPASANSVLTLNTLPKAISPAAGVNATSSSRASQQQHCQQQQQQQPSDHGAVADTAAATAAMATIAAAVAAAAAATQSQPGAAPHVAVGSRTATAAAGGVDISNKRHPAPAPAMLTSDIPSSNSISNRRTYQQQQSLVAPWAPLQERVSQTRSQQQQLKARQQAAEEILKLKQQQLQQQLEALRQQRSRTPSPLPRSPGNPVGSTSVQRSLSCTVHSAPRGTTSQTVRRGNLKTSASSSSSNSSSPTHAVAAAARRHTTGTAVGGTAPGRAGAVPHRPGRARQPPVAGRPQGAKASAPHRAGTPGAPVATSAVSLDDLVLGFRHSQHECPDLEHDNRGRSTSGSPGSSVDSSSSHKVFRQSNAATAATAGSASGSPGQQLDRRDSVASQHLRAAAESLLMSLDARAQLHALNSDATGQAMGQPVSTAAMVAGLLAPQMPGHQAAPGSGGSSSSSSPSSRTGGQHGSTGLPAAGNAHSSCTNNIGTVNDNGTALQTTFSLSFRRKTPSRKGGLVVKHSSFRVLAHMLELESPIDSPVAALNSAVRFSGGILSGQLSGGPGAAVQGAVDDEDSATGQNPVQGLVVSSSSRAGGLVLQTHKSFAVSGEVNADAADEEAAGTAANITTGVMTDMVTSGILQQGLMEPSDQLHRQVLNITVDAVPAQKSNSPNCGNKLGSSASAAAGSRTLSRGSSRRSSPAAGNQLPASAALSSSPGGRQLTAGTVHGTSTSLSSARVQPVGSKSSSGAAALPATACRLQFGYSARAASFKQQALAYGKQSQTGQQQQQQQQGQGYMQQQAKQQQQQQQSSSLSGQTGLAQVVANTSLDTASTAFANHFSSSSGSTVAAAAGVSSDLPAGLLQALTMQLQQQQEGQQQASNAGPATQPLHGQQTVLSPASTWGNSCNNCSRSSSTNSCPNSCHHHSSSSSSKSCSGSSSSWQQ